MDFTIRLVQQSKKRFMVLSLSVGAIVAYWAAASSAIALVTVIGVAVDNSAVKIFYNPVPGAKDYRVYDVTSPSNVKYAGMSHISPDAQCPGNQCFRHFLVQADGVTPIFPYQASAFSYPNGGSGGPQVLDVPATQIDYNSVGDNQPHTLIVEAVDQLGPTPQSSLYTIDNTPLAPGGMLGSNKGPTPDGKTSTNGQGPYTNSPHVIAQSMPFIVQANPNFKAIPSRANATQTFFDTFEQSENSTITLVSRSDNTVDAFGNLGQMLYTMNAGTSKAWDIIYKQANNRDSMPFISADHFMDMIFDGATPVTGGGPLHTIYGSMSMTPTKTIDISGGKVAHLTMEVDGHVTINRRWLDFNIAPASDPIQRWDPFGGALNNNNQAMFLELKDGRCTLNMFDGPAGIITQGPVDNGGGAGFPCDWDQLYVTKNFSKNGLGLDDKSRYDLFFSQTHIALFVDGQLIGQKDIPAGKFPWANVPLKAYYSHYIYHSDIEWSAEVAVLSEHGQNYCYPLNSLFINDPVQGLPASESICNTAYPAGYGFRYSDERHWDNMGFEVFPAGTVPAGDFSTLASLVQPPPMQAPGIGPSPPAAPRSLRILGLLLIDTLFPFRHAAMESSHVRSAFDLIRPPAQQTPLQP